MKSSIDLKSNNVGGFCPQFLWRGITTNSNPSSFLLMDLTGGLNDKGAGCLRHPVAPPRSNYYNKAPFQDVQISMYSCDVF
jgi:hypothetical protein